MGKNDDRIQATLKSKDTEEWLDVVFTRRVGYMLALFFERLGVHPNMVTLLSIVLGVGAGLCWLDDGIGRTFLGIILLVTANLLDSTDGQLARMTGQKTVIGRILDGASGDLWFISIYLCICFRLTGSHIPFADGRVWRFWQLFLVAVASGVLCHARQAALADYYRNIYLKYHGDGSELTESGELDREWKTLTWRRGWLWKTMLFFYRSYTRIQENMTPCFQTIHRTIMEKYGDTVPIEIGQGFCRRTYHLLKWTNVLTFNTRAIALYISLLAGMPLLYFVFEMTVMQFIFVRMRRSHEQTCREMMCVI